MKVLKFQAEDKKKEFISINEKYLFHLLYLNKH